jgi:hypothetical protein
MGRGWALTAEAEMASRIAFDRGCRFRFAGLVQAGFA